MHVCNIVYPQHGGIGMSLSPVKNFFLYVWIGYCYIRLWSWQVSGVALCSVVTHVAHSLS